MGASRHYKECIKRKITKNLKKKCSGPWTAQKRRYPDKAGRASTIKTWKQEAISFQN